MLWVLIKVPLGGTSNEYPQHMFLLRNKKKILCGYSLLSGAIQLIISLIISLSYFRHILTQISTLDTKGMVL